MRDGGGCIGEEKATDKTTKPYHQEENMDYSVGEGGK